MNLHEEVPTPELLQFYSLLENAFPQHSVEVHPLESREAYINEIRGLYFNGQDWRTVDFPEDENSAIVEAFNLLDDHAKLYYIAAYMREAVIDPYYQAGCLHHLKSFSHMDSNLLARMNPYQRESVVWFCDEVEKQIGLLPMMDRIPHAMEIVTTKSLRTMIRTTRW